MIGPSGKPEIDEEGYKNNETGYWYSEMETSFKKGVYIADVTKRGGSYMFISS